MRKHANMCIMVHIIVMFLQPVRRFTVGLKYDYDEDYDYVHVERIKSRRERKQKIIPDFCSFNGKIIYPTRKTAAERLKKIKVERELKGDLERCERNIYQCPHCSYYHLTSKKNHLHPTERLRKATQNIFRHTDSSQVDYSPERVSKIRTIVRTMQR